MATFAKVTWKPIATGSFTGERKAAYEAYEAAAQMVKEAKVVLEASTTKGLAKLDAIPAGKEPVYGYRFGQFSVAMVEPKANKAPKGAIEL